MESVRLQWSDQLFWVITQAVCIQSDILMTSQAQDIMRQHHHLNASLTQSHIISERSQSW